MRVLVTGGAGYIGSITSAMLIEAGHDVVVVDDLRTGHAQLVPNEAEFVRADVGKPDGYADVLSGVDACVHFAAAIEAGESMQRPEAFFRDNTAATLRLLAALVEADITRFVFSSTAAVYGQPEQIPIREDDPTRPSNVYGTSKLLVEQALPWLADIRGLRFAALRYFNASGATAQRGEMHDPETHLIPLVLDVAAGKRDSITIFGTDYDTPDGTCIRDYVHVADLAAAHLQALEALDHEHQIVCNLGNGHGFSVRDVIETARDVTSHPIPVAESARRPGDPARLIASSDRARDLLGWRPTHSDLSDIVASAWRWHTRSQP